MYTSLFIVNCDIPCLWGIDVIKVTLEVIKNLLVCVGHSALRLLSYLEVHVVLGIHHHIVKKKSVEVEDTIINLQKLLFINVLDC